MYEYNTLIELFKKIFKQISLTNDNFKMNFVLYATQIIYFYNILIN